MPVDGTGLPISDPEFCHTYQEDAPEPIKVENTPSYPRTKIYRKYKKNGKRRAWRKYETK